MFRNVRVEDCDWWVNWKNCELLVKIIEEVEIVLVDLGWVLVWVFGIEFVIWVMVEVINLELVKFWIENIVLVV